MAKRSNRMIGVMATKVGTTITLSWFECDDNGDMDVKMKQLGYYDGIINESVNKALLVLAPRWEPKLIDSHTLIAFSGYVTENVDKFDLVADAEEAEQALVSRYILEA